MKARGRSRRPRSAARIERLESRLALAVATVEPFPDLAVSTADVRQSVALTGRFDDAAVTGTIVRFATNVNAPFDQFFIELFDAPGPGRSRTTPVTAANFLRYVDAGRFTNTFIHRSVPGFVVQAGGYALVNGLPHIETFEPIVNEFGTSNTRGTLAMAKLGADAPGGGPDSATSEWFVNLGDNSANLDVQNGGFTVFGRVLGSGMALFDGIATQVPTYDIRSVFNNGALGETPLLGIPNPVPEDFQLSVGNFISFPSIGRAAELFLSVSSTDPALVAPSFVAGQQGPELQLDLTSGRPGTAVVTVRAASIFDPQDFVEDQFEVVVTQAPRPPSDILLSAAAIAENLPAGTLVGTLSAVDPDAGGSHTYALVEGEGAADNASFTIVGNELRTTAAFNFEARSAFSVRVRSTDQGGLANDKVFAITVTDVNESPTDILLSAATIAENLPTGTPVGILTTVDPDAGGSHTYALVEGEGAADNASFTIVGNELRTAAAFNFEAQSTFSVRVRSTDQGGLATDKVFAIAVTDVAEEPLRIEAITPPVAGFYRSGSVLAFTVRLSELVAVTGRPQVQVQVGKSTRSATYVGGSGTARLTFQYVVGRTETGEAVRLGTKFIFPRGSSIAAGAESLPTALPAAFAGAAAPGVAIDTTAPKASGRVGVPANGTYGVGQALQFVVSFTESVVVTGMPRISLTIGPARVFADYVSGSGGTALTFRYVVRPGDATAPKRGITVGKRIELPPGSSIVDRAGNVATATLSVPATTKVVVAGAVAAKRLAGG